MKTLKRFAFFCALFSCCTFSVAQAELFKPWLGNLFELQLTAGYSYQHYRKIHMDPEPIYLGTNSNYFDARLAMVLLPTLNMGVKAGTSKIMGQNLYFETAELFAQYLMLDDIVGDPVSMTLNLTVASTQRKPRRNLGRFHHGPMSAELGVSIGREWALGSIFTSRIWINANLGGSTRSSLYTEESAAVEVNFIDRVRLGVVGVFHAGFGTKRLSLEQISNFDGYRHIAYRAIDAGVNLKYRWGVWGDLKFEFLRRFWGRSCPQNGYEVRVVYHLPFSAF